jgi:hypothetical protein
VAAASQAGESIYYQPNPGTGNPWVLVPPSQIYPGSGYDNTAIWQPSGGGGGYGGTSQDRLAPLNAQLASRPYRGGSGGGSGAGAATASAVPAVVNPPAQSAPVQPNVTWSGLNTNVEKGESTI